ncbi:hypothetical protein D3P96_08225 [Weissella viridescens]|uniref:TcpE family n=1 Tax=Weissella viridescens TaxID=1629 RepID=A0A3P2RIR9_WEIVI|nr:hypothetical protein D3P96_08225 [Weissella viridescens]
MQDTYNYQPLYRHSYTIRGTTAKKYGGISYAISVETAMIIFFSILFVSLPLSWVVYHINSQYILGSLFIPPIGIYKLYDGTNPDGLKFHQYVWQYGKYYVKYVWPKRTLAHDQAVYYTEGEVVIK